MKLIFIVALCICGHWGFALAAFLMWPGCDCE